MRVRRPLSVRSKLLASVALVGLLLAGVGAVVQSAFTSTVRNSGNSFEAGTIKLSGNVDRESALFDLANLAPGQGATRCIEVSYASTADAAASVRLYGETTGELAPHLRVAVERGEFAGDAPGEGSCAGFAARGMWYAGLLSEFPTSYADALEDQNHVWNDGDSAAYRIRVELVGGDEAQGKSATHELTFEARTE